MKDYFGKCGCNCGRCPAFKANARSVKDRMYCRDGWNKYLGTNIRKYAWIRCDGCQACNPWKKGNLLPDRTCNIRPCALKMDIKTCAQCPLFPCIELKNRIPDKDFRKHVESRLDKKIPDKDYRAFIKPYEGIENIRRIRRVLKKTDIVERPKILPLKARFVDFPQKLKMGKSKKAYKQLHEFLVNLITARSNTYAGQIRMKARRLHLMGILWAFGFYGEFKNGRRAQLVLDSRNHRRRKQVGYFVRKRDNRLFDVFSQALSIMKKFGVTGKFIPVKDNDWLLKLSFSKKSGRAAALKALKKYTTILAKKYGEPQYAGNSRLKGKAFALFIVADMRVLL